MPWGRATGRDSPVRMDSSTSASPSSTTPSATNDSPGCTRNRSPGKHTPRGNAFKTTLTVCALHALGQTVEQCVNGTRSLVTQTRSSRNRPLNKKKTNMVRGVEIHLLAKMPWGSNVPAVLTANVMAIPRATGKSMLMRRPDDLAKRYEKTGRRKQHDRQRQHPRCPPKQLLHLP